MKFAVVMKITLVMKFALVSLTLLVSSTMLPAGCSPVRSVKAQSRPGAPFDVTHYEAVLEIDFAAQTLRGEESIRLISRQASLVEVALDAAGLTVESVTEDGAPLRFETKENRLLVQLARAADADEARTLRLRYRTKPERGVRFFSDHVYAAYQTPRWLPVHFHPADKATFNLRLIVPAEMKTVANGLFKRRQTLSGNRAEHAWEQALPIPPYIFGFAAGNFQETTRRVGRVELRALFRQLYTPAEAARIFASTPDILAYFERRAGAPLPVSSYTQVLASGRVEQEMSGFTVMRETYGREVLLDERDNWLAVHEFAHEWWGNSVTCADWSHFWLNESIPTLLADDYQGTRFGRDEYDRQIEISRRDYNRFRAAGRDRPLAFRRPIKESEAGGLIVYDKGALVLHLLRFQLGERAFWQGLRDYTSAHMGGLVVTDDLQRAMERANGQSLTDFFEHWVYRADVPDIRAAHDLSGGELRLRIERREEALWPVPLVVAVETTRGRTRRRVLLDERTRELRFPVRGELRSVRLDEGGHLPVPVRHERPVPMLLYQLAHEPDVAGRADALSQLRIVCAPRDASPVAGCELLAGALAQRVARDSSRLIRQLAGEALGKKPDARRP